MSGFGVMGASYFASYRDPNLGATNEVYEGVTDYVKNFHVDERDMTKYVIGTISEIDTPLTCEKQRPTFYDGLAVSYHTGRGAERKR